MQIEITDDDGNIVIVNESCYVYVQDGNNDVYIEWEDLTPPQLDHVVELIGVVPTLDTDLLLS